MEAMNLLKPDEACISHTALSRLIELGTETIDEVEWSTVAKQNLEKQNFINRPHKLFEFESRFLHNEASFATPWILIIHSFKNILINFRCMALFHFSFNAITEHFIF